MPAPSISDIPERTESIVNDFDGLVTKDAPSSTLAIKYKYDMADTPSGDLTIRRLGSTLEKDPAIAALVQKITYYGDARWPLSNGDTLISHCVNVEEIKSLTANADWPKVLAGKFHLTRLNLYTCGDYYDLKLPTLLNVLKECKELAEIRISGDSMRSHSIQGSTVAYGSFNTNSNLALSKVQTLTITPEHTSCNSVDLHFLMKLCPNIKKLGVRVDSGDGGCETALNECFGAEWKGITELELLTSAVTKSPVAVNLDKLVYLQSIQTHQYIISPSALPNIASLTSIEYEIMDDIDEVIEGLKNYLSQASNANKLTSLSLVTTQDKNKDNFTQELKAVPGRQGVRVGWPLAGIVRPRSTKMRSIYDRADKMFQ